MPRSLALFLLAFLSVASTACEIPLAIALGAGGRRSAEAHRSGTVRVRVACSGDEAECAGPGKLVVTITRCAGNGVAEKTSENIAMPFETLFPALGPG